MVPETSLPFTHTQPQQLFRLLELPPELLELLESDNPPTLSLKSPPNATDNPSQKSAKPQAAFVNLCTPSTTYSLRQVNSSNSILLLRPGSASNATVAEPGSENNSITTIGQCKSLLEVQKLDDTAAAGLAYLRSVSREYGTVDLEEYALYSAEGQHNEDETVVDHEEISEIFADMPYSLAECQRAWTQMCGFICLDRVLNKKACWRPSASVKLAVWKHVLESAMLHGIDLRKQFLVQDLWKAVIDADAAPFSRAVFEAVVRRLADRGDEIDAHSGLKWASFDEDSTVSWVGEVCLEATAPGLASSISRNVYMTTWKDLLPEQWRTTVSIDRLSNSHYQIVDSSNICFKPTQS
ncbi:hypothetical protein FQN57_005047 [Myotisia sp. PD_48]|nr:hypothetical protein FQN57_005047 [Myotisia sp. PD_48]